MREDVEKEWFMPGGGTEPWLRLTELFLMYFSVCGYRRKASISVLAWRSSMKPLRTSAIALLSRTTQFVLGGGTGK